MNTYVFTFQHARSLRYLLLALLGPSAGVAALVAFNITGIWGLLALIVAPIAAGFYLMLKRGKVAEEITMDGTGFTSAVFGRVEYTDIVKVGSPGTLMAAPPSMKLTLSSGRKLAWLLAQQGSYYNSKEDAKVFEAFAAALAMRLKKHPPAAGIPAAATTPAQQAEAVVRRNGKNVWAIPVSLAFALIALVKTCGRDWFKRDDPDFAKMARQAEERYHNNIEKAKAVMQQGLQREGSVFLYTNDTAATVELLPDIDDSNPTGIAAFRHTKANEELAKFIEHPDSFQVNMVVRSGDKTIRPMRKSRLNMFDSAGIYLYCRVYDPSQHLVPPQRGGAAVADSSAYPVFDLTTAVPVYDTANLADAVGSAFPGMHMLLAQVRRRPVFRLYLAGRGGEGVSESLFARSVAELNRQLHEVGVDTTAFRLKTLNR